MNTVLLVVPENKGGQWQKTIVSWLAEQPEIYAYVFHSDFLKIWGSNIVLPLGFKGVRVDDKTQHFDFELLKLATKITKRRERLHRTDTTCAVLVHYLYNQSFHSQQEEADFYHDRSTKITKFFKTTDQRKMDVVDHGWEIEELIKSGIWTPIGHEEENLRNLPAEQFEIFHKLLPKFIRDLL